MQSSITAWLRKPAAVKQEPAVIELNRETNHDIVKSVKVNTSSREEDRGIHKDDAVAETDPPAISGTSVAQAEELKPSSHFKSTSSSSPPLIPNITLEPCTAALLPSFKRLNTLLLPIPYPPKFYSEILSDPTTQSLTLLAIWRDNPSSTITSTTSSQPGRVIGAIRCRLLGNTALAGASPASLSGRNPQKPLLYISTICVLSPYRHYGIATHLLETMTATAIKQHGVGAVGAHVWVNNDEGKEWYKKRGFAEVHFEEGYYSRLNPKGALVVRRDIGVGDLLGRGG